MKKRKQSNELRSNPTQLSIHRYTNLSGLKSGASLHWGIEHLQPFFPSIECLFKSEHLSFVNEYGLKLKNEILSIKENNVRTTEGNVNIHIKKTMLLSPFKWMQGDYGTSIVGLPTSSEQSNDINTKLQNPNNAAYVGSLISVVLSESGCVNFPKVYGVFSGVSHNHTIDISDDYEELIDRSWFSKNIGKTFDLKINEELKESTEFQHTRTAKTSLQLGEETTLDNVEELETTNVGETSMGELKNIFEEQLDVEDSDDTSSVATEELFEIESCCCDELEIDEDDDEDFEPFAWATFKNVPVQLTIMEKCNGTLYELMSFDNDTVKHLAWITQVIFALAFAQRNYGFVHNDLHANNIMYVPTDEEFLYYNVSGTLYKVPTYGYIIKIIDFERGIMSLKLVGMKEPKLFISDHFHIEEEAGGQYNVHPFYDSRFPEIKPNPSFDLVRLATSLFWDFFPEGPNHEEYKQNAVFCLFMKWLMLDDNTSVFFGKQEPRHDRYHGFMLYKAIARYCKDTAVPRKELFGLKTFYETSNIPLGENVLVFDN